MEGGAIERHGRYSTPQALYGVVLDVCGAPPTGAKIARGTFSDADHGAG